ncbi:hypothetical protein NPIL_418141 [Nephila pilipes]|uniref:Uncharacterized protein n=1 Tax=Nephila pilipes TaxID=299642 RepID=A0A8X6NLY5_NEPPI|nr:hypothetical protein NPIL_418141 [Nephila pilipes]
MVAFKIIFSAFVNELRRLNLTDTACKPNAGRIAGQAEQDRRQCNKKTCFRSFYRGHLACDIPQTVGHLRKRWRGLTPLVKTCCINWDETRTGKQS